MKILFLNAGISNYLVDGLFYGLRSIEGVTVVDAPRIDVMYNDATPSLLKKNGNRGVTLYGLLDKESDLVRELRYGWRMGLDAFDLIIISDILRIPETFIQLSRDPEIRRKINRFFFHGNFRNRVKMLLHSMFLPFLFASLYIFNSFLCVFIRASVSVSQKE